MRSAGDDLTARAAIREAALRLFADRGPEAVTVRQIAAAAGVSPALVLHHFESKAGLQAAVDEQAARAFDEVFALASSQDVHELLGRGGGGLAEAFTAALPTDSPLPAYLRRLLLSGHPSGRRLFARWYEGTVLLMGGLHAAGAVRPSADQQVRAAFLLVNDLALILLREPIEQAIGVDPLSADGIARWAAEVTSIYREGLWHEL